MRDREILFWDFDGVIKESVGAKTEAYVQLFESFGGDIAARVRQHHESNGGMSRFAKIPLYLRWAGQMPSEQAVAHYCELFSATVRRQVIESPWVPGAREYLEANRRRQQFVIVSATPQGEMEDILRVLRIEEWFREVHGAPTAKASAIGSVLARWRCRPTQALVIGDSMSDYEAARAAGVDFLLRRTPLNQAVQRLHEGAQCEDFLHE